MTTESSITSDSCSDLHGRKHEPRWHVERTAFNYVIGPLVMSFNRAFRQK
jgi:hypothetical protein